jgi:hypothetical protein
MIPELVDNVLPEGIHECTFEEVEAAFGRFWKSDRRIGLTRTLKGFLDDARRSGIVAAVVIDGSYVTGKAEPNDIDLVVAYRADFDLGQELRPFEYNVISKGVIRRTYRFDAFVFANGSPGYLVMGRVFQSGPAGRSGPADRASPQGRFEDRPMIRTDNQLESTRAALHHAEAALASLIRRKADIHPDRFALMAEPILDQIQQLRASIDEYMGQPPAVRPPAECPQPAPDSGPASN